MLSMSKKIKVIIAIIAAVVVMAAVIIIITSLKLCRFSKVKKSHAMLPKSKSTYCQSRCCFNRCYAVYHSISSMSTGFALSSTALILPDLTEIVLSAMGLIAELWVMITTVTPKSRLSVCKSLSIDFPVT